MEIELPPNPATSPVTPPAAPPAAFRFANPGPLGLAGFGLTTVVLSCVNAGLLAPAAVSAIVPLAFAYGGVAQIIAGILEFKTGNTFGMVAFTSYGLFWWWFALMKWTIGAGWLATPSGAGVATTLLLWGALTFLLWLVTFRLSLAVWSIFLLLWITFFFLAAGDYNYFIGTWSCTKFGGYIGLLTGIDALLVAFIEILNETAGRIIIPLGRPIIRS